MAKLQEPHSVNLLDALPNLIQITQLLQSIDYGKFLQNWPPLGISNHVSTWVKKITTIALLKLLPLGLTVILRNGKRGNASK